MTTVENLNLRLEIESLKAEVRHLKAEIARLTGKRLPWRKPLCKGPGDCGVCQRYWCEARRPF